jgi:hypothetical protein
MDFDQTWYILSPWESLELYWFSRSKVKVTGSNFYRGFQTLIKTKYVPSLVKIHWRMLILECSQGWYVVNIWPLDFWPWKSIGFQTLLRTLYVPSLVKIHWRMLILECSQGCYAVKISPGDFQGQKSRGQMFTTYHPWEHSRINILQWILTKLGTYLVFMRVWNPIFSRW